VGLVIVVQVDVEYHCQQHNPEPDKIVPKIATPIGQFFSNGFG
jgi:hypothetical protein